MHIPVLLNEVIKYLDVKSNENFIDCTIGQGGHSKAILEKSQPNGKVLGIDWDLNQIENCKTVMQSYKDRLILDSDNYDNLTEIINRNNFKNIDGILLDIGFSSFQIEGRDGGFSFLKDENLDMRYSPTKNNLTAEIIINEWSEDKIKKILEEYGEEKFSKQIARKIIEARKTKEIKTTLELVGIIEKAVPRFAKTTQGKHFATRTFQALRIAVNGELDNLTKVLPQAIENLDSGARLLVISFHSLEDRIVKNFFNDQAQKKIVNILTKKPILAQDFELKDNPRSRSAKLRAITKI